MVVSAKRVLVFICMALFLVRASADDCLVIADDFGLGSFDQLKEKVFAYYAEAGFCTKVVDVPASRAARMVSSGQADGLLLRSEDYLRTSASSLIFAKEPIGHTYDLIVSLISRDSGPNLSDFRGAVVGNYRSTMAQNQRLLKGMGIRLMAINESDYGNALEMVKLGRIDGVVLDDVIVSALRRKGDGFSQTFTISEPILPRSLHLVLSNKHKDKLARLDAAIRRLGPIN